MAEVTVVIPNYNGAGCLRDCLDALREQTCPDFRTILVDNASEDDSVSLVQRAYPEVTILAFARNYGFSRAANEGIRAADTPFVFLLNNDTKPEKECIAHLLDAMRRHPQAFSVCACLVSMSDPDRIDDAGDYYCALGYAYALGKGKSVRGYQRERRVFASCAGAALYRRDALGRVGDFDETYFAYLEDIDLGYRARLSGYENWYAPSAVVRHVGSATSGSRYNPFKVRFSARNNVYLIRRNMPRWQIVLNSPFLSVGFFVKWLFFVRKGFGATYRAGLKEGAALARTKEKHVCPGGRKSRYFEIQLELWRNLFRALVKHL